jgi:hypothetical protein
MQKTTKRQRRPARSVEEWKDTVDAWHRSGLTGKVYAEQHGVAVENLYKWTTRLGLARRASGPGRARKGARQFVAVGVAASPSPPPQPTPSGNGLEVEWPSGVVMRFPSHISEETLATLLRMATEGSRC